MAEVQINGRNIPPIGGLGMVRNSAEVYYPGNIGAPVLDDTIEVQNEGFYVKTNSDVIFGGTGAPVLDDTIEVVNRGLYLKVVNDVTYGAVGKPNFDGSLEVQEEGFVLTENADNKGKNVFIVGDVGEPVFDDEVTFPPINGTPPDNRGINVTYGAEGNRPVFDDEVVFFGRVLNFSP